MISLIHPSRGRPEQARKAYDEWLQNSAGDFEYFISIDTLDPKHAQYYQLFDEECILLNNNRSIVDAVNVAAKQSTGDIIVVMSDDFGCPRNWDEWIELEFKGVETPQLLHVHDTIQFEICTLPILNRQFYDRVGYVYYGQYFSMFADNDLTDVAKKLGAYVPAKHLTFEHRHYVNGKAKLDATYQRENSKEAWKIGEKVYKQRKLRNFDL